MDPPSFKLKPFLWLELYLIITPTFNHANCNPSLVSWNPLSSIKLFRVNL